MTTYTAFVAALAALSIDDVETTHTAAIDYADSGDLPAQFPRLPSGGSNEETQTTCIDDGRTRTAELVVLVQATGQGTTATNFAATVTMVDNVEAAVKASKIMPLFSWDIVADNTSIPGFWAVIATVTGVE